MKILPCLAGKSLYSLLVFSVAALFVVATTCRSVAASSPEPLVAIHVSELTQALETMPAVSPTPTWAGTTGYQWFYTAWHYFVAYETLKEALLSDGTPFVEVTDSDILAGKLRNADGSPRYPILISLVSEAIDDNEIPYLRDYVSAGGFIFSGSSSFTRKPDGASRGDFALANEMGLHQSAPNLFNWSENRHFITTSDHRLTSHFPSGTIRWNAPTTSDDTMYNWQSVHYTWNVVANGATVIATGDNGPLLTVNNYGLGQFIFHGPIQPLLGHGGYDLSMYSYLIYRRAIEWAFESFSLPIVKVSPWQYQYNAAFLVRHDFENDQTLIKSIEASAQFENSLGVKGNYFFSTGALRSDMQGDATTVAGLKNAVSKYGATIGSHNGGLKNPARLSLLPSDTDYWHWGPDEALNTAPAGYASGKAYASASILASFQDIEGWLVGLDNGRSGCGALKNCPRIWVAPAFNSAREDSRDLLDTLHVVSMGEQKICPFPSKTLSYKTKGRFYSQISLPVSEWYIHNELAQSTDFHTVDTIRAGVDFYYNLGALINFYGHTPSNNGGAQQEYVSYGSSKPLLWSTNAVGINDWWRVRSSVVVTPTLYTTAGAYVVTGTVSGATDPNTAIEMVLPQAYRSNVTVFLDGKVAASSEYRTTANGMKIKVGSTVKKVRVQSGQNQPPVAVNDTYSVNQNTALNTAAPGVLANDTDPEGATLTAQLVTGPSHGTLTLNANGSFLYTPATNYSGSDSFTYRANDGVANSTVATVGITVLAALFTDDFTRTPVPSPKPFTWIVPTNTGSYPNHGVFDTVGGTLNSATDIKNNFGMAYTNSGLTDTSSVEVDIKFPDAGTFGGGIVGRLDPATGRYYTVWISPEGASGVSATISLVKVRDWSLWINDPVGMKTVSIPALGTGWHHLKVQFTGNRIQVFYDDNPTPLIDETDSNSGGYPAYTGGSAGIDFYAYNNTYGPTYDNFIAGFNADTVVYSEDFGVNVPDPLSPWSSVTGTWAIADGVLSGSSSPLTYTALIYPETATSWANYSVEAQIRFPVGAYGGGISGHVNPATGARYGAWIYPDGSAGGSNILKLIKFRGGNPWSGASMGQVTLPSVGTGWNTVNVQFNGNRISVYYNGTVKIDVTDNNFDSIAPYVSGGISAELYTSGTAYKMEVDSVVVRPLP